MCRSARLLSRFPAPSQAFLARCGSGQGNVGQGNWDKAMSVIPLTFIPLPSADRKMSLNFLAIHSLLHLRPLSLPGVAGHGRVRRRRSHCGYRGKSDSAGGAKSGTH